MVLALFTAQKSFQTISFLLQYGIMLKGKSLIFVQNWTIWGTVLDNATKKPMAILAKLKGSCVQMVESSSTSTIWSF